jgi:hypothetical protein
MVNPNKYFLVQAVIANLSFCRSPYQVRTTFDKVGHLFFIRANRGSDADRASMACHWQIHLHGVAI